MNDIKVVYDINNAIENQIFTDKKRKIFVPIICFSLLISILFLSYGIFLEVTRGPECIAALGYIFAPVLPFTLGVFFPLLLLHSNWNHYYATKYHVIRHNIRKCAIENDNFIIYTTNRFFKRKLVIPIHFEEENSENYDTIDFVEYINSNRVLYKRAKNKRKIVEEFVKN